MGNPSNSNPSLDPLHKTLESLKEIKLALLPFLRILKSDRSHNSKSTSASTPASKNNESSNKKRSRPDDDDDKISSCPALTPHRRAEAEAAVALAIGTLRYMGARLRGLDQGRKKGDPLRMEMDKIRGMLVALRNLESDGVDGGGGKKGSLKKKEGYTGHETKSKSVDVTKDGNGENSAEPTIEGQMESETSESSHKKQRR